MENNTLEMDVEKMREVYRALNRQINFLDGMGRLGPIVVDSSDLDAGFTDELISELRDGGSARAAYKQTQFYCAGEVMGGPEAGALADRSENFYFGMMADIALLIQSKILQHDSFSEDSGLNRWKVRPEFKGLFPRDAEGLVDLTFSLLNHLGSRREGTPAAAVDEYVARYI